MISVQALTHFWNGTQSFWPLPHCASGVFQNLMLVEVRVGLVGVQPTRSRPSASWSMIGHASELAGVSPNDSACCACGFGVEMYFIQRYAQFGCGALVASSQRVGPTGRALRRDRVGGREAGRLQRPGLQRPRGADDDLLVLEQRDPPRRRGSSTS